MPVFRIELDDGRKLRIEADSHEAALAGVQHFLSGEGGAPKAGATQRGPIEDFVKSMPGGALERLSHLLSAAGTAASHEMSQPEMAETMPTPQQAQQALEQNVTGKFPEPQGRIGKFGAAVGGAAVDPSTYLIPGSLPFRLGVGAGGAVGSEAAGQLTEDQSPLAQAGARLAGSIGGMGVSASLLAKAQRLAGAAQQTREAVAAETKQPAPTGPQYAAQVDARLRARAAEAQQAPQQGPQGYPWAEQAGDALEMVPGVGRPIRLAARTALRIRDYYDSQKPPPAAPEAAPDPRLRTGPDLSMSMRDRSPGSAAEPAAPGAPWGLTPEQQGESLAAIKQLAAQTNKQTTAEAMPLIQRLALLEKAKVKAEQAQNKRTVMQSMPLIQRLAAQNKPVEAPAVSELPPKDVLANSRALMTGLQNLERMKAVETAPEALVPSRDVFTNSRTLVKGLEQNTKLRTQAEADAQSQAQSLAQQLSESLAPTPPGTPGRDVITNARALMSGLQNLERMKAAAAKAQQAPAPTRIPEAPPAAPVPAPAAAVAPVQPAASPVAPPATAQEALLNLQQAMSKAKAAEYPEMPDFLKRVQPAAETTPSLPIHEQHRAALLKSPPELRAYAQEKGLSDAQVKTLIDENYSSPQWRKNVFDAYTATQSPVPQPVMAQQALTKVNGKVQAPDQKQKLLESYRAAQEQRNTVYSADDARSLDLLHHTSAGKAPNEAAEHIADMMAALEKPIRNRNDFIGYVDMIIQGKDQMANHLSKVMGVGEDKLIPHIRAIATRAQAKEWRDNFQQFEPERASRIGEVMGDKLINKLWKK